MIEQAKDFRAESEALYELLQALSDADLQRKTQFKDWSINHVIGHLHLWNHAADLALCNEEAFDQLAVAVMADVKSGSLRDFEEKWLAGLNGHTLLDTWRGKYLETSTHFAEADPKARLKWVGPGMSARSSITARLMETWAHGQEVYDLLGVERVDGERIRNVAQLGINTFGWTFMNRRLEVPADVPCVRLTGPSGAIWEWNPANESNRIEGSATEFCQVVTQVRNIADTQLQVRGDTATRWMAIAQCFAGGPVDPPAKGLRHISRQRG